MRTLLDNETGRTATRADAPILMHSASNTYPSGVTDAIARWCASVRRLRCPKCESMLICRSGRHGLHETILKYCGIVPWRCTSCIHRFSLSDASYHNREPFHHVLN